MCRNRTGRELGQEQALRRGRYFVKNNASSFLHTAFFFLFFFLHAAYCTKLTVLNLTKRSKSINLENESTLFQKYINFF